MQNAFKMICIKTPLFNPDSLGRSWSSHGHAVSQSTCRVVQCLEVFKKISSFYGTSHAMHACTQNALKQIFSKTTLLKVEQP